MDNSENIYNQALEMLKVGHSQEEVLFKFSHVSKDLAPLLSLSHELLAMPKNTVPTPQMKRKYALAPTKNFWLTWVHVSKFAGVSVSLMLLISAFLVTGYQTLKSSPGQTLFTIKKSAEKLQLILAANQGQKANLQITIAQKRLSEAKGIFNNPNSGVEQKKAALTELADQTSNAINEVNTVAHSNPKSEKNSPLLDSLASMAHDQQSLLAEISPDSQIEIAAGNALQSLNENTAKISEIKQSVAVASGEEILVKLDPSTDSSSTNEHLLPEGAQPQVKSSSTTLTTGIAVNLKKSSENNQSSSSTTQFEPADPSKAIGSFIFEDPRPQFIK